MATGRPWLIALLALALLVPAACAGFLTGQGQTDQQAAACQIPLRNPADAALCEGEASTIGREDVSVGGTTGLLYRLIVPDQEPTVIMATMTAAALAHRGEADELTLLAYGEAGEASGDFTRGRLVVAADGSATYDVCTAWNDATGTTLCADQTRFSADIFD